MGDLVKYEEFITELSETKQIRGGKLPVRVYTIIIMEPDAINLKELEQMKKQGAQPGKQKSPEEVKVDKIREEHAPNMEKFKEAADGVPKK